MALLAASLGCSPCSRRAGRLQGHRIAAGSRESVRLMDARTPPRHRAPAPVRRALAPRAGGSPGRPPRSSPAFVRRARSATSGRGSSYSRNRKRRSDSAPRSPTSHHAKHLFEGLADRAVALRLHQLRHVLQHVIYATQAGDRAAGRLNYERVEVDVVDQRSLRFASSGQYATRRRSCTSCRTDLQRRCAEAGAP